MLWLMMGTEELYSIIWFGLKPFSCDLMEKLSMICYILVMLVFLQEKKAVAADLVCQVSVLELCNTHITSLLQKSLLLALSRHGCFSGIPSNYIILSY